MADSFAVRLQEILEHQSLSLQQVASAVGLSRTAVHKWTRGGEIDYDNLRKLAGFLEVNWLSLRYGEEAVRDITSIPKTEVPVTDVRRRITAEIMSSEARMKLAQAASGIVTWEWNLISDELFYSDNCEKIYGRVIRSNRDFWEILHPDEFASLNALIDNAISTGKPYQWDFRIILPSDEIRWISSRTDLIFDESRRPVKMLGTTIDITERKQKELLATQRDEALTALLGAHAMGWRSWRADSNALSLSSGLLSALGMTSAELHDHEAYAGLCRADDARRLTEVISSYANSSNGKERSAIARLRYRIKSKSGGWFKMEETLTGYGNAYVIAVCHWQVS